MPAARYAFLKLSIRHTAPSLECDGESYHFRAVNVLDIGFLVHGVEHRLVLPAPDAAVVTGGALSLDRAPGACRGPVDVDLQAMFHCREALDGDLSGRTAILVVLGDVDEVLLVEPAVGHAVRVERLRYDR